MATDTQKARMLPVASRYCYCVCDKKRRKHPAVRLQLFPKDARSAISISGDWARCGSRGGQLYHYYRKYGTQLFSQKDIDNEWFSGVCQEPLLPSSMVPPPAAPVTSPHIHAVEGTPIRSLLRNTIYRLRMRIQQMGREAVRTPHQLIATAANFLASERLAYHLRLVLRRQREQFLPRRRVPWLTVRREGVRALVLSVIVRYSHLKALTHLPGVECTQTHRKVCRELERSVTRLQ
ncbi:hypothetical protein GWK47_051153 [Chionoecetes opilio]|uniref:Uncharacterized protein n=1 Tax=Chionoecetes opilio TaxID=41210 RepID=A0A8J4YA69_CHIOP|nr:hypothetical protein GWK47_051153 [Chionoecetes opilio]